MSEPSFPQDPPQLAITPDASLPIAATPAGATSPPHVGAPVFASPGTVPPEMAAFLELIGRGLATEADDATRATARELWARCAHAIVTAATAAPLPSPPMPALAAPMALAPMPAVPVAMPAPPVPVSPIAVAAQTLRGMSADQLLDLALQRLRAALPAGAAPSTPKGIQFQLVPIAPPHSPR